MRYKEFTSSVTEDSETYQPPPLSVGDAVNVGKFKNVKAEIKGFGKDKNNQPTVKTTKGTQQLFKPRIMKLMPSAVSEEINPDILNQKFRHTQEIGEYVYKARATLAWGTDPGLEITCYDGKKKIGMAAFFVAQNYKTGEPSLISSLTDVLPVYQRKGIASNMYAYARSLGNSIHPSANQSAHGKAMWDGWKKSGDAASLNEGGWASTDK